jgi:hypothetical protein
VHYDSEDEELWEEATIDAYLEQSDERSDSCSFEGQLDVDDCSYVRHSPAYKPMRCGSLQLCESFSQLTNLRESP